MENQQLAGLMPLAAIEELLQAALRISGSQRRLGEMIGVRPGTVSLWLKGVQPSSKSLHRLEALVQKHQADRPNSRGSR